MYGLLMRVSAEAVRELCADKRHLGALPGILSVLHTWNGQLHYHCHVHMLITGGGVSSNDTHVTFCWKDRDSDTWRTVRLPGVEFLRRFLQHVLPRGFHKVRYYGLWHSSKRDLSSRAWLLLMLQNTIDASVPMTIANLLDLLSQPCEDEDLKNPDDDDRSRPCCPHCGNARTTLLGELPRSGIT